MRQILNPPKSDDPLFAMVFYLKKVTNINNIENEISLELCKKYIPYHLKNLFLLTFGDRLSILTEEQINKFIEENR